MQFAWIPVIAQGHLPPIVLFDMMDAKPATHLVLDSLWAGSDPEKLVQVDQFTGSGTAITVWDGRRQTPLTYKSACQRR